MLFLANYTFIDYPFRVFHIKISKFSRLARKNANWVLNFFANAVKLGEGIVSPFLPTYGGLLPPKLRLGQNQISTLNV
jgi:hypothetical protein